MRIVDSHVHLYPDEVNRAPAAWAEARNETHWATLCTRLRRDGRPVQEFPSLDGLLRAMDEAGVDHAILQGWYWQSHDTCVLQNRFYAACVASHPDRLSASATFHPAAGREVVLEEIERVKGEGFVGMGELSPHSQGFSIDDPVWRAAMERCAGLHLPVNLHVTEPRSKAYPGRVITPLGDFVRLARECPTTTFVLAHWGARLPLDPELGEAARGLSNVYYDSAASPLLYDRGVFREMIDAAGPDRVLHGSDHPLELFPRTELRLGLRGLIDEVGAAGLSIAEKTAFLGGNAARLFKLDGMCA